ncbi:MAG: polysaccharide biosynthesis protein [Clostridia bacterium]|nr:polysaccharide biosynthesis protein [Clostridia bacterium]
MSEKAKSVAKGISILGLAGIICKVVGLLFSIPLNMISSEEVESGRIAMVFYLVYPTYTLLLTISSAGIPVAVSRMVAGFLARNDVRNARNTFRTALITLLSIGGFFSLVMVLMNGTLSEMVGVKETSLGYYAIAPCVMIVCVLSAFRGLFQGQQNMVPTAVSQLIEQIGKVIISLPLAYIGVKVYNSLEIAAAGALFGITAAEIIAMVYMIIRYHRKKGEFNALPQDPDESPWSTKELLRRLVIIAVPITVSACIIPLSQFIDSAMMVKRMVVAGLSQEAAENAYGVFTSVVIRLINIPTALALAISISLVPGVSARFAVHDMDGVRRESHTGMRYAFLIGFPCSVGMSILARPIVAFFYDNVFTNEKINLAAELLTFSAMTVVLFTAVQATSSILQGLRKQKIPMYTMMAGVAVKIILNFILIGTPGIDIHGGPYASIACYGIVMIINMIYVCRYAEMKFNWMDWVVRPGLAAAVMGAAVWLLKKILPGGRIATIICVIAGVIVFGAAAYLLKAVTKDDIRALSRRKKAS